MVLLPTAVFSLPVVTDPNAKASGDAVSAADAMQKKYQGLPLVFFTPI